MNNFNICISYILLIIYNTEQDTDTLRAAGNRKKTLDLSAPDDDPCDDDFQVVESHSSETARSGNTSKYFGSFLHKLTSSCVPVSSSSPLSVPLFIKIHV